MMVLTRTFFSTLALGMVSSAAVYRNPVVDVNSPDPGALAIDGGFVVVTSSGYDIADDVFPLRTSLDLAPPWTIQGYAFPHGSHPTWAAPPFYAPELHALRSKAGKVYWLVYDATELATGNMAIGAAWSLSPLGPFTDLDGPLRRAAFADNATSKSAIDATLYQNTTDDSVWLLFKNKVSGVRTIALQSLRLSADGRHLAADGPCSKVLAATEEWEAHDVEGPFVWGRGEFVYMFYSGSNTWFNTYAIGVARARSVEGPWTKDPAGPIIHTRPEADAVNTTFVSPGHNSVAEYGLETYLIYHANRWNETGVDCTRYMMLDRLLWEEGWPRVATGDGAPSDVDEPRPVASRFASV